MKKLGAVLGCLANLACASALATAADASTTTYSSLSSFNDATSGDQIITFDGLSGGSSQYYNGLTLLGVTFTQPNNRLYVGSPPLYDPAGLTSDYLYNSDGNGGIVINLSRPIYAFAAIVGIVYDWTLELPIVEFSFAGGSDAIEWYGSPYAIIDGGGQLRFLGISSTIPFSSITVDDQTNGVAFISFEFTTQMPGASAVPEPPTWATILVGFLALSMVGYYRAQQIPAAS
jgi:hypothetical protein